MAGRVLPGIGLTGDWDLGENNWKDANDENLRFLSVLLAGVMSIEVATPGAPAEGDRHLFTDAHPTHPEQLALYDEAAWHYFAPVEGMTIFNAGDGLAYRFTDGAWSAIIRVLDQATYDAIVTKDPNTFYFITA